MNLQLAHVVLADISGYTQFMRLHRMSVIHAEQIITDLLESVIEAARYPLILNKLEGDAALFYSPIANPEEAAESGHVVLRQVREFFEAFNLREKRLVSACALCVCEACGNAGNLRLKVIIHTGTIVLKHIRQHEEIAGEDVILVHRLLKNSVPGAEYLMLTDAFFQVASPSVEFPTSTRVERHESGDVVRIHVHYPSGSCEEHPSAESSLWQRLRTFLRIEAHMVKRTFIKRARSFRNLPP